MMNILIVDDIPDIIAGLVEKINWSQLGITKVFSATSAALAKQHLLSNTIDILLCDIEMPEQNGLELLAWIRSQNIPLECVFLTSHAEFDYAREAVRLGSFDYILQPAPYKEITSVLERTVQKVIKNNELNNLKKLQTSDQQVSLHLASHYIYELLNQTMSEKDCIQNIFSIYLKPDQYWKQFSVVMLEIFHTANIITPNNYYQFIKKGFEDILHKSTNFNGKYPIIIRYNYNQFFLIFPDPALSTLQQWFDNIKSANIFTCAVYVGNTVNDACFFQELKNLLFFASNNILHNSGMFIFTNAISNNNVHLSAQLHIEEWENFFENNMGEKIVFFIKEFFSTTPEQRNNLQILQSLFWEVNAKIVSIAQKHHLDYHQFFQFDELKFEDYLNSCKNYNDFIEMIPILSQLIFQILSEPESLRDYRISATIKNYIDTHLNENLSRKDIASHIHLNEDYMAKLFKKETGMQLKEYILTRKINFAKELLKTTNLSVSLIAVKVGFTNFSHFSQVFKKLEHISPNEYRNH